MIDIVTGGAGFIGSHLVRQLLSEGRRVRVIDNFSYGRSENLDDIISHPMLELHQGDICDEHLVSAVFTGAQRVFHLAALTSAMSSIDNPTTYFRTNADGTLITLQAAKQQNVARYIYVASASCYGITMKGPIAETTPCDPQHPYALSKYLGEQMVMQWAEHYRLSAISLRLFNVYGPHMPAIATTGSVFDIFLSQRRAGVPLTIAGDGMQTRDFVYISDVLRALTAAAASNISGEYYNVGSAHAVTIQKLAELMQPDQGITHIRQRQQETIYSCADTTKINRDLGWKAEISLDEGLHLLLKEPARAATA